MDHRLHVGLLIAALGLPMAIVLLVAAARLLAACGDAAGALGFDRAALAVGVLWGLALIALLLAQSWGQLATRPRHEPADLDEL